MNSLVTWLIAAFLLRCTLSQILITPTVNMTFIENSSTNSDSISVGCVGPANTTIIEWLQDETVLDINGINRISATYFGNISSLTIMDIRVSDGGRYQCRSSDGQLSAQSGYFNIMRIPIVAPSIQQLVYQTNGRVECTSVNDTLGLWYTLNPRVRIMSNGTYTLTTGALLINNVQLYHDRQYECEHLLTSNPALKRSVIITVNVVVPSMLISVPVNQSVVKGQPLNITFEYLAIPSPNFTWFINDNLFAQLEATAGSTHTMIFTNVSQEGWYRCRIQNGLGTAEYSVFVDVLVPPQITTVTGQIAAAVQSSVVLSCSANGDAPLTYIWRFSGSVIADDARINGATSGSLTISGLVEADNGTYTCEVSNLHGIVSAIATLIVIDFPQQLSSIVLTNVMSTSVLVTLSITANTLNQPVDHVIIGYRMNSSSDVTTVSIPVSTSVVMLQQLFPNTTYVVNAVTNNLAGNSTISNDQHFTTVIGVPKIDTVAGTSDSYSSIQLSVVLLYNGGRPISQFHVRSRIVNTSSWSDVYSVPVDSDYDSSSSWQYDVTDLLYDVRGYEVEVTAESSVGQSEPVVSLPIVLFTDLPGKPELPTVMLDSVTENSTTISCHTSAVGQPILNVFNLAVIQPTQQVYSVYLNSYSVGLLVSIQAVNLTSDTEYQFTCYASNVAGDGEHSDPVTVRTKELPSNTTIADAGKGQNLGIIIGIVCAMLVIVLVLFIMLLYAYYVKKVKQNIYLVKSVPNAEENRYDTSPGAVRRQVTLERVGNGGPLMKHQVGDTLNFNRGEISSIQFSRQASSAGNVSLSKQVSNGMASSYTRQLSNPASSAQMHAGYSSETYPLDKITAHYHISDSSSSLYDDDDDSKLSYPPSAYSTHV